MKKKGRINFSTLVHRRLSEIILLESKDPRFEDIISKVPVEVEEKVISIDEVKSAKVELTFEPLLLLLNNSSIETLFGLLALGFLFIIISSGTKTVLDQ